MKAIGLGTLSLWFFLACGRTEPSAEVVASPEVSQAAAADVVVENPEVAAEQPSRATGKRIGLAYAGNMYGELEPCG